MNNTKGVLTDIKEKSFKTDPWGTLAFRDWGGEQGPSKGSWEEATRNTEVNLGYPDSQVKKTFQWEEGSIKYRLKMTIIFSNVVLFDSFGGMGRIRIRWVQESMRSGIRDTSTDKSFF